MIGDYINDIITLIAPFYTGFMVDKIYMGRWEEEDVDNIDKLRMLLFESRRTKQNLKLFQPFI